MLSVDRELDRILTLLRNKIRERGFTQLEVQEALSWGRSYISQLLTKQKSLRIEQVLLILNVIGVKPGEFYDELYRFPDGESGAREPKQYDQADHFYGRDSAAAPLSDELQVNFQELRSLLRGLVWLLTQKGLVDAGELIESVNTSDGVDRV